MRPVTVDHKYLVSLCLDTLYIMAGTYSLGYLGTLILKIESEKQEYLSITILWYILKVLWIHGSSLQANWYQIDAINFVDMIF